MKTAGQTPTTEDAPIEQLTDLTKILQTHLKLHAQRTTFIAAFVLAIIKVRVVQLPQIALAIPGKAKNQSKEHRCYDFLTNFELDPTLIARMVLAFFPIELFPTLTFSMDRTDWKFGSKIINYLVIGIVYKGLAYPIVWVNLDKAGTSNTDERILVIQTLLKLIPANRIQCLCADREFPSRVFLEFLRDQKIKFAIRSKDGVLVTKNGCSLPVWQRYAHLKVGQSDSTAQTVQVYDPKQKIRVRVHLCVLRLENQDLLVILCDSKPGSVLGRYKLRWNIELLFGALKTRGFDFEKTHITDPDKTERLLSLVVIALVWCHRIGEFVSSVEPLKFKEAVGCTVLSVFRYGLDCLRGLLLNGGSRLISWGEALDLLREPLSVLTAEQQI